MADPEGRAEVDPELPEGRTEPELPEGLEEPELLVGRAEGVTAAPAGRPELDDPGGREELGAPDGRMEFAPVLTGGFPEDFTLVLLGRELPWGFPFISGLEDEECLAPGSLLDEGLEFPLEGTLELLLWEVEGGFSDLCLASECFFTVPFSPLRTLSW